MYLPDEFDETRPQAAVLLSTPGSGVKEQVGANYASGLAECGLAALVSDPAHQGQSGGEPGDLEDPYRRREDISYAIDALGIIPGIDALPSTRQPNWRGGRSLWPFTIRTFSPSGWT